MKKSIAVILFSLYGLSQMAVFFCGHYESLLHTWASIRQWTLLHVGNQDLTIVSINSKDISSFIHNEEEFIWQGSLYDIVHIKKTADKTVFTLEKDEQEQKLMKKSSQFHSLAAKKNRSLPKRHAMKNIFQPLFINEGTQEDNIDEISKEKYAPPIADKPHGMISDGTPHPPEHC
jgi:hypothetical protein